MDTSAILQTLNTTMMQGIDVYERRTGAFQLIIPILHEDGDMVDIYVQDSPHGNGFIRISDFGLTLMRLSYTFDPSTPARQRILDSILINNGVGIEEDSLYLDTRLEMLYEGILQFAGCVQKVCNMRYWSRETVRSAFYEDLGGFITAGLGRFSPLPDQHPLPSYEVLSVDWALMVGGRDFFLYGVLGNDKAKNVAIALLEFQKSQLAFVSMVVHEDMAGLGQREVNYLTKNADHQYPTLSDFRERGLSDLERLAGVNRV